MEISPRIKFLIKSGLRGVAWLLVLMAIYLFFKKVVVSNNLDAWIEHFYARPEIIYLIYFASEFIFGIIPPEFFMIWALHKGGTLHYFFNVGFFAIVSYAMGYLTFLIGKFLFRLATFRYIRIKYMKNLWPQVRKYGLFLIIVAALTPVPWAAVSLLVGSAGFPSRKYLVVALFRLLRFAVYGYIIFQTHQI
ncbi:MAG: hypothetical protein HN778_20065 [Prolixibacteraceae bacterium]|jgi:hypothetical protein|nr:hypothetical protein [Prolixibacteraceae bacterium]MBT6004910.1 hypothetical protein [Prolixibacteraceae bacterium]MBT6766322.1 hypothetical protein [Prolixibacteraceae bacterium]MBT6998493.1 hypothetical protein [Prolixibacteraceae bacterium]MBT7397134.1 hypothetical protein [Prolixibacteraceae bacterium]